MSGSKHASCCNMEAVDHCVSCDWTLQGGPSASVAVANQVIYTANGLCPTVSGKVKFCTESFSGTGSPTTAPQFVTVQFLRGTFVIKTLQVPIGSCIAFTVAKFDAIRVARAATDTTGDYTLSGEFCLTPTFTTH